MTRRFWAAMLAMALLLGAIPMMASAADVRTTRCNLLLRKSPSTDGDKITTIPGGTDISVLGTSGSWTKTQYNGHTGYVSSNYLMDLTRSGYYPLREGDESQYVKALQEALKTLGYFTGSVNSKYEKTTTEAVKAFQKQNGISADGIAGGETQRVLYGDSAVGGTTGGQTNTSTNTSTNTTTTVALRVGDKGEAVKKLQERLIELGYLSGKADGVFGSGTETAVKAFQKASSLTTDGKAGAVTQNLLYSANAKKADGSTAGSGNATDNTTTGNYDTLKRGMTSNNVKKLQEKLKELGYMTANATGYFGSATQTAVKAFQKANNLGDDGIAGSATQTLLYSGNAIKAGSSSTATDNTVTGNYGTLKQGMKSTAVTTLQKKLKELGYMTANATGYYGSATQAAVKAFQKANNLTADGVAGPATQTRLYSGIAVGSGGTGGTGTTGNGKISGPSASSVKLLHWQNTIKPSLKTGDTLQVYDPSTGYGWKLKAMSLGRHCDSEPLTAADTLYMNAAFGNKTSWSIKVVYIKLPSGTWTMATQHNTPHLSGTIKDNNFDGHLCVHFLRDMAEAEKNDPNYGVQNQKVLREAWKALTGQTVN